MNFCRVTVIAVIAVIVFFMRNVRPSAAEELDFQKQIVPILNKRCVNCHGAELHEAKADFSRFADDRVPSRDRKLWRKAITRIEAGEMPPASEPPIAPDEKQQLLRWMKQTVEVVDCNDPINRDPGPSLLRRLSLVEYNQTIRDLLGFEYDASAVGMPEELGEGNPFGNLAAALDVSPPLMEKYFTAADQILDRSVLDLVLTQAKDLRRSLGRSDQQKLEQYLTSVRAVETRLAFLESRQREDLLDLATPGPSKIRLPQHLPKQGTPIWEITRPLDQDPSRHADYIRLMADMMVLAFQTDTTRVMTVAVGSDESLFPGVVTVGYERHCHTLEHQGNSYRPEEADPISREACRQIHAWYTQLFAETVRKMQELDEGGSSLLDNTVLLFTSYMADGGHGREDYPVVLAGKAGGR